MRFKWHWGIAIAVVYIGFVLIRVITIVIAEHNNVDLVSPDYYEKEIRYEDRIAELRNSKLLTEPVTIKTENRIVTVYFPASFPHEKLKGDITLFRPSDKKLDKVFPVKPDSGSIQRIDLGLLQPGYWKMQIQWGFDEKRYYDEFPLVLR